ncbi:MAG: S58 family peptidase [Chloroflexi bacterium]|nr:MAG: S58 family peptidase [Chloroflexota bacterium]
MPKSQRAREAGITFDGLPTGPLNAITDVPGVTVGQVTLHDDDHAPPIHTGVTVIIPHPGDLFNEKLPAAVHTINGFGKAAGFEQVREMGTLETPIALTNTLCVGRAWDGLVTWMLARHPEIGTTGPSVNPLVAECNDSRLNDLRGRHVTAEHVLQALEAAAPGPAGEGSVGAGTGMVCYGYKGGIGTASRQVTRYTLAALLVANFGSREQLTIRGVPVGRLLQMEDAARNRGPAPTPGSVVIVLATDAPLTDRQLGRVARRAVLGLARTGSTVSSGSGDFVLAFSTAQKIRQPEPGRLLEFTCLPDGHLDPFFQAAAEATEEAVINALFQAAPVKGPAGQSVPALPVDQVVRVFTARSGQRKVHL